MLSMLESYFGDTLADTKEQLRAVSMGSRFRGNDGAIAAPCWQNISLIHLSLHPMTYDTQNAFARILRGELPSIRVHEDAFTIAIMDIMPQAEGHVLVIPKEAAAELMDLSEAGAEACARTVRRIAIAVKAALNPPGVMVAQFNGSAAGQTVPHVHFHIVPRRQAEALKPHGAVQADPVQLQALADRIVAALQKLDA